MKKYLTVIVIAVLIIVGVLVVTNVLKEKNRTYVEAGEQVILDDQRKASENGE